MANPFSELGVSDREYEEATSGPDVLKARIELAEEAAAYWRSVSPVLTGEYVKSVKVDVRGDKVHVLSDDDKAYLIEFGTVDTPEFAPRAKTQAKFNNPQ